MLSVVMRYHNVIHSQNFTVNLGQEWLAPFSWFQKVCNFDKKNNIFFYKRTFWKIVVNHFCFIFMNIFPVFPPPCQIYLSRFASLHGHIIRKNSMHAILVQKHCFLLIVPVTSNNSRVLASRKIIMYFLFSS